MKLTKADELLQKILEEYGTADIAPVRRGKWEVSGNTTHYYICSICGKPGDGFDNYCRSCGAKNGGYEKERKDNEYNER